MVGLEDGEMDVCGLVGGGEEAFSCLAGETARRFFHFDY